MATATMAATNSKDQGDELVLRARTDSEALGVLYARYYEKIYRYCLHRLFVREVAEDVTSSVFLQVAEHIVAFEGHTEAAFRNWLYAIASNQANSHVRKTVRRRELLEAAVRERLASRGANGPTGEELDWPTVYEAIAGLKPNLQTVITLRFFEEMTFDRIADILGCKSVTVRVSCGRALEALRKKLSRPLAEDGRR
jgi:RNA polymerase sigma-70 factor (ECF subfamily)